MNKSVVQNFLVRMPKDVNKQHNVTNAISDAKSYRWKKPTLNAIVKGINLCYENKKDFYEYLRRL